MKIFMQIVLVMIIFQSCKDSTDFCGDKLCEDTGYPKDSLKIINGDGFKIRKKFECISKESCRLKSQKIILDSSKTEQIELDFYYANFTNVGNRIEEVALSTNDTSVIDKFSLNYKSQSYFMNGLFIENCALKKERSENGIINFKRSAECFNEVNSNTVAPSERPK